MTPPEIPNEIPLDMRSATHQQIRAIQKRADREGISFDEAALRMLIELEDELDAQETQGSAARLFRFPLHH